MSMTAPRPGEPAQNHTESDEVALARQTAALERLLDSWLSVDELGEQEQRETLRLLRAALTEEPLSDRPRFR